MVLLVEGVTKCYGTQKAVDTVSFTIPKGSVVGFVGANGAGKSTTIKAILNFHRIQAGRIEIFGKPHTDKTSRTRLGFLAERPYFYDGLKGLEFLEFYGRLSGLSKSQASHRAHELMELVGLPHVKTRLLREYSKGMTQRMGIAQALVHEPDLLILDEPMSGLDPMGRLDVRRVLESLKTQGKTIFFSSHILPDIEAICDDVVLIHKGKLVTETSGAEVLKSSVKYMEWVLSGTAVDAVTRAFPHARHVHDVRGEVILHLTPETHQNAFEVHQKIHGLGARVLRMTPYRESLEDVMFGLSRGEIS